MKIQVRPPVFLVGCPRSGTTLLQSMLAAHPEIASFRESKFFHYILPEYEPRRRVLGLVSRQLRPRLEKYFQDELGRPEILPRLPWILFMGYYTRKFTDIMYSLTREHGKSIWLEKTPDHIYKIEIIEKLIPDVRFIHLLRNGSDVVASLYEVTNKYPKPWGGPRTIDICINDWIGAVEASRKKINKQNHIILRYEDLVENPYLVLEKVCAFIGIAFDARMVENYSILGNQLSLDREGRSINQELVSTNDRKFFQVFNEAQRLYIMERLSQINLDDLICNLKQ